MNLDLSYLEDITAGDSEMMFEMLNLFIEDIPVQVSNIEEFANSRSMAKLGAEAHKLKPTTQYIGLSRMFELVKELEMIGKSETYSEKIIPLVNELKDEAARAVPLLIEKKEQFS